MTHRVVIGGASGHIGRPLGRGLPQLDDVSVAR